MSDKKISDSVISDAAELLYKGAKMLTYHCPDCKLPLFEKDGKIFCASCGREAIFEKDLKTEENVAEIREEPELEKADGLVKKVEIAAEKVCEMIVSAKSSEEVKILTDSLEKLVNVLNKLKK